MASQVVSPLVSCATEVLANITSRLSGEELLSLYMTDKTGLRPRLTHRGGVESIYIHQPVPMSVREIVSFPFFPTRFNSLRSLKILLYGSLGRTFVLGSLLYLPSSLTSLHIHHESALTAWLQPVQWTGNNDDTDWGKPFKPIYLDRLFPNLVKLVLSGNLQLQFNPTGRNMLQSSNMPYFEPVIASIMSEERKLDIDRSFDAKLQMEWTTKMKNAWFRHLPHTLLDLELTTTLPVPDEAENCCSFDLLPPHLTRLVIPQAHAKQCPNDRLSRLPSSLRDSLVELSLSFPSDSPIFDAPLPHHLTTLRVANTWATIAQGMSEALPPDLTILTVHPMCTVDSISYLPPNLTQLELPSCPIYQLLGIIPQRLTHLNLNIRYASDWPTLLPHLPLSLATLNLCGEGTLSMDSIKALPRELLHFSFDGSSQQSVSAESLLHLPPYLLSLRLGQCSTNLEGEPILHALPQTLTSLELQSATFPNDTIPLLPPNLTKLELPAVSNWTDDQIHLLPKNLTRLRLSAVRVTGRLLKEGIEEITARHLQQSVTDILPPSVVAEKKLSNQVRYSDPVYFSYDQLLHVPKSVTKIEFSGQSGVALAMMDCLPNLTYLDLPSMTNALIPLRDMLPALTYLSAPKVSGLGVSTAQTGHLLFPPGLTHLNLPSYSTPTDVYVTFPLGLTYLSINNISSACRPSLGQLTKLETFRMETTSGIGIADLPPLLPRSIKHLYLGTYAQSNDAFLKNLPPKLETLDTPNLSVFSDNGFHLLPETVNIFRVGTFAYKNIEDYRNGPEMTEFDSPANLVDILCHKRSEIRFKTEKDTYKALVAESGQLVDGTKVKMVMTAKNYDVFLGDELASIISRSVTRLKLSELHRGLSIKFLENLPPTLLHLDLGKQEHGFNEKCALAFPKGLLSLSMIASVFTDPNFLSYLPKTILDLELTKLPGRLSVPKAQMLPPALTRLRLGLCIVGDEALPLLPRSLTILDLPNTPFITNKGIPDLPPSLTKLWIPTSRLTPDCVDLLPISIGALSLGSGSGFPASFVLAKIKQRSADQAAQATQAAQVTQNEPINLTIS